MFQYNYCFGGTSVQMLKELYETSFNTTIVSVELIPKKPTWYNLCRFNTTIVSVELEKVKTVLLLLLCFNTTIVSVEPIGGIGNIYLKTFQYNYCFGGTEWFETGKEPFTLFQYNYCFGGTSSSRLRCCTVSSVSIQLLFRWNIAFPFVQEKAF